MCPHEEQRKCVFEHIRIYTHVFLLYSCIRLCCTNIHMGMCTRTVSKIACVRHESLGDVIPLHIYRLLLFAYSGGNTLCAGSLPPRHGAHRGVPPARAPRLPLAAAGAEARRALQGAVVQAATTALLPNEDRPGQPIGSVRPPGSGAAGPLGSGAAGPLTGKQSVDKHHGRFFDSGVKICATSSTDLASCSMLFGPRLNPAPMNPLFLFVMGTNIHKFCKCQQVIVKITADPVTTFSALVQPCTLAVTVELFDNIESSFFHSCWPRLPLHTQSLLDYAKKRTPEGISETPLPHVRREGTAGRNDHQGHTMGQAHFCERQHHPWHLWPAQMPPNLPQ